MKRQLTSVIAVAGLTGVMIAAAPFATAVAPRAASVRSYSNTVTVTLTGLGRDASFLDHTYRSQQVTLNPLAYFRVSRHDSIPLHGKETITKGQFYLVGGNDYAELNGAKTWTTTPAAPGELRGDAATLNPASGVAKLRAIPGVKLAAPREYQVTTTPGRAGAFLAFEFGVTARNLTSAGIGAVTITLLTDQAGRSPTRSSRSPSCSSSPSSRRSRPTTST